MSSFVTGGKTWRIPTPFESAAASTTTASSTKIPPAKSSFKVRLMDYITGMGTLYVLYALAFIIVLVIRIIAAIIPNDYNKSMNSEGGLILSTQSSPSMGFQSMFLAIVLPIVIYTAMTYIETKTKFITGPNMDRNLKICIGTIVLVFTGALLYMTNDWGMFRGGYDSLNMTAAWMESRYGFTPYNIESITEAIDGRHLYPADPNFPAKDVYLKEVNGAYFLFDPAGKELPIKN